MATYSSFLAWEIPWTEEPGELQLWGLQLVGLDLATKQQNIHKFSSAWHYKAATQLPRPSYPKIVCHLFFYNHVFMPPS